MPGIPDEKLQEIRDRADVVDLVGRYVGLRRAGQNYKGLCPFHEERTPSFHVNPVRRSFKCFGCGVGGDAIEFVIRIEGKSFPEAARRLAELYGVVLPEEHGDPHAAQRREERDEAYAIVRAAAELYRAILSSAPEGELGRRYRAARRIFEDTAETFGLGYAPAPNEAGWDRLARTLAQRRLSLPLAERLGLVGRSERTGSYFDKFRGRLMFPIAQLGGEPVAFSGRVVPPHDQAHDGALPPKYLNSPESLLFSKGKLLFGLSQATSAIRSSGNAVLVEGNLDVVSMRQSGLGEAVAPLGTALTAAQATLLARFTERVVVCFDGDRAGRTAARAAVPVLLDADLDVQLVVLEDGADPDSTDPARLRVLVDNAEPALEVLMTRIAARAGTDIDARARAIEELGPLFARVKRESAQYLYAERASALFGIPVARIRALVREKKRALVSTSGKAVSLSAPERQLPPLPDGQAELVTLLIDVPHLASLADKTGVLDHLSDPRLYPIARAVVEGAKRGENHSMHELLDLIAEPAQAQIHERIFSGKYRDIDDPRQALSFLLHRCQEQRLDAEIRELEAQAREAKRRGDVDEELRLHQRRFELRRRQDELHHKQRQRTNVSDLGQDQG